MKRSRIVAAALILPVMMGLSACGKEISRNLDDAREQYAESNFAVIYGPDYQEFYVQCPGVTADRAKELMDSQSDKIEDNSDPESDHQNVYLRGDGVEMEVKPVKLDDTNLCGTFETSNPEAFSRSATTVTVTERAPSSSRRQTPTESATPSESAQPPADMPEPEYRGWLKVETPLTFRKPERHEPWQLDTSEFNKTVGAGTSESN